MNAEAAREALEALSVAIARRWLGVDASLCAVAWVFRSFPEWRLWVWTWDALFWRHERNHCRQSARRCGLE